MATDAEVLAMQHAIQCAWSTPRTLPNPRVGCVIIDADGNEIARGAHRGAGSPHAEVVALEQAGRGAYGATAVVTLEPCNHIGRTGPCAQALIQAGISRVVFAQTDPNPRAQGGEASLAAAGVTVEKDVLVAQARELNTEWSSALERGRPFITFKYAATLDGFSAAADGTSQWISGGQAREETHRWRAQCDVIMVGTGTVLADNPTLTARDRSGRLLPTQPTRVVMGQRELPDDLAVFSDEAPTVRIRSRDPGEALGILAQDQVRHVWLEGGPRLGGAFLQAGLIDRIIAYIAPGLLGAGLPALTTTASTLTQMHRLNIDNLSRVGDDIRVIASVRSEDGSVGEAGQCSPVL